MYLLVFTGSQAVGSYLWGVVATREGLGVALTLSAVLLGGTALSVVTLGLRPSTGKLSRDISRAWPSPMVVFEPCPNDGPVLVTVRYRVATDKLEAFVEAMSAVRRSRLRTGGHSWGLYHSLEHPDTVLERFTVPSWTDSNASTPSAGWSPTTMAWRRRWATPSTTPGGTSTTSRCGCTDKRLYRFTRVASSR